MSDSLSFGTRFWFAFVCFFRVLFDGEAAARFWTVRDGMPELPAPESAKEPVAPPSRQADTEAALQLLGLLQREGRLVDFLQQEVADFSDQDIGAAARVVHEGCRKALRAHAEVKPIRSEEEGASVEVAADYDAASIKLTGNVGGKGPYKGVLRHRGWRVTSLTLPALVGDHDPHVVAPAEVEL